jgi:hypothetical protein
MTLVADTNTDSASTTSSSTAAVLTGKMPVLRDEP